MRFRVVANVLVAGLLAGGALAGCGGGDGGAPLTGDALVDEGGDLYRRSCAICHGRNLEGSARGPSHLDEVYRPETTSDEVMRASIYDGAVQKNWEFGPMPRFGFDDEELDALIAFIRAEQERQGFTTTG